MGDLCTFQWRAVNSGSSAGFHYIRVARSRDSLAGLHSPPLDGAVTRVLSARFILAVALLGCASPGPTPSPWPTSTDLPVDAPIATRPAPEVNPTANPSASSSLAIYPTQLPSPIPSGTAYFVTSDDGLLTVELPPGALADPLSLTATARGEDALPPELQGMEVRSAFYDLAPTGIQFVSPVTITRRVSLVDLELDGSQGMPILVLALRAMDGTWEWLAGQTLRSDGGELVVSAQAWRTGTLFAFGGRAFTATAVSAEGPIQVGGSLRLTATLTFPDDSPDPPLLGFFEPLVEDAFVALGDAEGPDNRTLGQTFVCAGAGSATVGVRYSVLNVGADSALFDQLGLAPVATRIEATTLLTCLDPGVTSPEAHRSPS